MDWLSSREASTAILSGVCCEVTDTESVATLRTLFLPAAMRHGLADLDAGVLRLSAPRALTQQIAAWAYDVHEGAQPLFDGVGSCSRHGDDLSLWAVFERPGGDAVSARPTDAEAVELDPGHPDLGEAFRLHRLTWAEPGPAQRLG